MIKAENISIEQKENGIYLSAETKKGKYGQFFNTENPGLPNFAGNEDGAKQKFIEFYNQFEVAKC